MDLQYNTGEHALYYISKYVTKPCQVENGSVYYGTSEGERQRKVIRYQQLGLVELVMDLMGYHLTQKSSGVNFLPTDAVENRRSVLKRSNDLRALDPSSTSITLQNAYVRYLIWPLSTETVDFNNMSYVEFSSRFRQVYTGPKNNVLQFTDLKTPTARKYQEYQNGRKALLYWRTPRLTDTEDCCLHFLMLYMPARLDTDQWLQTTGLPSFLSMAVEFFGIDELERLVPGISTNFTQVVREPSHSNPGQLQQMIRGLTSMWIPEKSIQLSPAQQDLVRILSTESGLFESLAPLEQENQQSRWLLSKN